MKQNIKEKIENLINSSDIDEKKMVFQLKQLLYEAETEKVTAKESQSLAALASESLKQLDNTVSSNFIKSGLVDFDQKFGGFSLGEFVVLGARPAMGKTQLLVNLALYVSAKTPVLYFTFDLSVSLLANRFMAALSGIPVSDLLQHKLTDADKEKLTLLEEKFERRKVYINDSCSNSITALKAHCKKMIEEKGIKMIIVDCLQMMSSNKFRNNRELEISYISRELRNIAKEYNVSVIASSELNRGVESRGTGWKSPILSDLRDSGGIEQAADKVIFMYRPGYYGFEREEDGEPIKGETMLNLAKNKNGRLGEVRLLIDDAFTRFNNFDFNKGDFVFSPERLAEMTAKNPALKNLMDGLDLSIDEDPPF